MNIQNLNMESRIFKMKFETMYLNNIKKTILY